MVDDALILRKLSELDEYFKQINEYEQITVAKYTNDWKTQRIIERTLQMMIETCVDIASHIIADKEYRVPKSYSDTFKVFYEENGFEFVDVYFVNIAGVVGHMESLLRRKEIQRRPLQQAAVDVMRNNPILVCEFHDAVLELQLSYHH